MYDGGVPKLWNDTIEAHRRDVHDAVLDATAALVSEHGLLSVTMSGIAEQAGIGRATLYKYFPDVEAVLLAWHERQISAHLAELIAVEGQSGDPGKHLEDVLIAFALLSHQSHDHGDTEIAALLHRGAHVARADEQLHHLMMSLVSDAVASGDVRDDMSANEIVTFCLHALSGASRLPTKAAVQRLVAVTLDGIRPRV
jgi:AcrR family transcriptional regulator